MSFYICLNLSRMVALRKNTTTVRKAQHQHTGFQTTGAAKRINMKSDKGLAEKRGKSICSVTFPKEPGSNPWEPVVSSVALQVTLLAGRSLMPRLRARMVNS